MVVAAGHGLVVVVGVALVAGHEAHRAPGQIDADLALFGGVPGEGVEKHDRHPVQGQAHGARLDGHAGHVVDGEGELGLTVAVSDGEAPLLLDLVHGLGVERLTCLH